MVLGLLVRIYLFQRRQSSTSCFQPMNGHASYQSSKNLFEFDIPGEDAEDSINDDADDGEVSACGGDSLPV